MYQAVAEAELEYAGALPMLSLPKLVALPVPSTQALWLRCSAGLGAVVQHGGRHGAMRRGRSPNKGRCCIVAFCEEDSEVKP